MKVRRSSRSSWKLNTMAPPWASTDPDQLASVGAGSVIPMLEKPTKNKELKLASKGAKVICKDLHLFSHFPFDKKQPTFLCCPRWKFSLFGHL